MSHGGCHVPRVWMRRQGAVWACQCGKLWTVGYLYDFLTMSKSWVPLDDVRRLARERGES